MINKLYAYLAAAAAFVIAVGLAILKGMSIQKNKTKVKQKEVEIGALKAVHKAEKQAEEETDANSEKADSGDFTGLNR